MIATARLDEVAALNPRLKVRPSDNTIVSFLGMADVGTDGSTTEGNDRPFREVAKGYTYFERGDVLVAKITPCFENGKIAQARTRHMQAAGSTEFHVVRPNSEVLEGRYLHYYLRQSLIRIEGERRMTGSGGQRRVPESYLAQLQIPVPPIEEQRRIAKVLDQADELRAKRRQTIALLDDIAQSIFLDMFGDPASNLRNWDVVPLGEISSVQGGLQVTSKRNSLPIEVAYLRVANVYRNHLNLEEIKTMRVTERELARTALEKGDLLVVEGHGNPQEIGRVAQWDSSIVPCVHQNHLIRVRLDECARPAYILALLNSIGGRRHLLRSASTTSGLNTISTADVKATPIMLPPQALQDEFVRSAEQVNQARAAMRASLQELDELFLSLEARAFRGKL